MKLLKTLLIITLACVLTACGGGGGGCKAGLGLAIGCDSTDKVVNTAPLANAGASQAVLTGAVVSLDGMASTDAQNDPLLFSWAFDAVPQGSRAVLVGSATSQPYFVADVAGVYTLRLVVSDGQLSSSAAVVVVTASVKNEAPVASAGANQSVVKGALVTLDGTSSTDPNRNILTFSWAMVSRPAGSAAVLSSASSVKPTFVADQAGSYVASLRVNDGFESSAETYTTVVVSDVNAAPVAVVSANQNVLTGATVTLDGTGSSDANRDPLTYTWVLSTRPAGSAATLSSVNSPKPSFVADVTGLYVASLKVSDGRLSSDNMAITTVTASAANVAPVAVVSANPSVLRGAIVTLDGTGSSDANRDPLTYSWTLVTKPEGSVATLSSSTSPRPSFIADMAGNYVASLVVNDGNLSSALAVGSVTASIVNAPPVAVVSPNQNVMSGAVVTLDGSNSNDPERDVLTYSWVLSSRPAGSAAVLSSSTSPKPTFTADVPGVYVASLSVNDGKLTSALAVTSVTANAINSVPVAAIGPDQSVLTGAVVKLDGRFSSDANRDPLTYKWAMLSKPLGSNAALSSTGGAQPTFTADVTGTYVVSLVVSDGQASSEVVATTVLASVYNAPPVADAGPAQTVKLGAVVTLNGTGSTDVNQDVLTYSWAPVYAPVLSRATLSSRTVPMPTLTPDVAGLYVFSLVVNDGRSDSALSTVTVTVVP